jgi:hypothetical protein
MHKIVCMYHNNYYNMYTKVDTKSATADSCVSLVGPHQCSHLNGRPKAPGGLKIDIICLES